MRTTAIALAGTLVLTASFLAGCNDDVAPLAKDSTQANQVTPEAPSVGGAAASNPLPESAVAPAASSQIVNQLIGCGVAWGLGIAGTLVILKICDAVVGVRVGKEQEMEGLDISLHGEEGYIIES